MTVNNLTRSLRIAVTMALAAVPVLVSAQQAPASSSGALDEVVVTATRRESNLQQTPIAVSALDQNLIEQASPQTISDLAAYVPNFSAAKITGFNAASFAMRGVGNTSIIVYDEAPVAVILDDFDRAHNQDEMLEVLEYFQQRVKLVIATVNDKKQIDQAILRPGRFDELISVKNLDTEVVLNVLGKENAAALDASEN